MSDNQILTDLARHTARMEEQISIYYQDSKHEQAFRKWYMEKFGHVEVEGEN